MGRLDEAKPDIERALSLDPRNSDANSLLSIIAVVQNDNDLALKLANQAVELGFVESISPETVRQLLKKTNSSRGNTSTGAFRT